MKPDIIFSNFLKGYEEKVENYDFLGEDIKNAFPLLKFKDYLNYCIFERTDSLFNQKYYLVLVDNEKHFESYKEIKDEDIKDFKRLIMETDIHKRFEVYLNQKYNHFEDKKILKIISFIIYPNDDIYVKELGELEAEHDYEKWREENRTPVDSYDHEKISPYSHLDYEGIIANFDSKKYRDDFEYQMNQANECYKRKLFLPAAATLSVALETLLMAICDKENVKLKSKDATDTMMNYLGERLLQEGKINYRMHKRIDVTYSLRNSVSHSNPGEVSKADCQIILSCIKTLIDKHYSN
ncbi:hypothetical protein H8Z65_14075 [Mycobacterium avium subsp. hominissuis]|uniref:hypothetical protein n=1 Tax=Mycobacterium avium TaxID=1764 RepID=UPI001CE08BF2|nr:hypothetical protein [Mycobacterium avium]MCA4764671.1 hypothetical protein [Mycobacterium avium subsp. hominissuis]